MQAYKMTYIRIGDKEPWSGWKIAGKSKGLPSDCHEEYFTIQSGNSITSTLKGLFDSAPVIWEFINTGKNIYYSKLTYGFVDHSPEARISMRSDGLAFSVYENPELVVNPALVFNASDDIFNNVLNIEKTYPQKIIDNVSTINLSDSEIYTIFDPVIVNSDNTDINQYINHYFTDKKQLFDLIKCILWTLTDKSDPSINLIFNGSINDMKNIVYTIISLIPICFRNKISFRTQNIPEARAVKITFSLEKGNERYFDLATGENNIIKENKLDLRWKNYDFVTYAIENIEKINPKEYFELLGNIMGELGDSFSIDMNFIKLAHDIVLDEYVDGYKELTNQEILQKFYKFLTVPLNNEKVDWYCSKLLETIIDEKIPLNESIQERLQSKLKVTKSEDLKRIGYSYNAILMVNSRNREKEFEYLYNLKSNEALFKIMCKNIMECQGGDVFLDEYYGKYFGNLFIKDYKTLREFVEQTKFLRTKQKSNALIDKKCQEIGLGIIDKYYEKKCDYDLARNIEEYYEQISYIYQSNIEAERIINGIRQYFWGKYSFLNFSYSQTQILNYKSVEYSSNPKCSLVNILLEQCKYIEKGNAIVYNTIAKITENEKLTIEEKDHIVDEIQKECVKRADRNNHLDFWCRVALLNRKTFVKFMLKNGIRVFTNTELLAENLYSSELFTQENNVKIIIDLLNKYEQIYGATSEVSEINKVILRFQKERKNERKKLDKQKKKDDFDSAKDKRGKSQTRVEVIDGDVAISVNKDKKDKKDKKNKGFWERTLGRFKKE